MTSTAELETRIPLDASSHPTQETNSKGTHLLLWIGLSLLLVMVGFTAAWFSTGNSLPPRGPLPIAGDVAAFSLIERDGRTVTRDSLKGNIWLANFVFTTCTGPCHTLSLRMRSLHQSLKDYGGRVKCVSLSLDPAHDTPAVLTEYARKYDADPNWLFLTGISERAMHSLIRYGFLQSVIPATNDSPMQHSTYFVLVDGQGRLRGFYDGMDAESKAKILKDLAQLLAEPDSS